MDGVDVIRLVTQFDRPLARPTVATPTCCCGGCSCCCSCIVTLIAASTYTAVNAQSILHQSEREAPARVRWSSPWPGVAGFFALPLAVLAVVLVGAAGSAQGSSGLGFLFVFLPAWFGLVGLAYWAGGAPRPWWRALAVVVIGSIALVAEFFLWLEAAV